MNKKLLALVLAVALMASLAVLPAAAAGKFPDAVGTWAESSIDRWADAGLVQGDTNGNVNPTKDLTRAEMAAILVRLMGLTAKADANTFSDVAADDWFADAVLQCAAAKIMLGDGAGHAIPNDSITREQAATMICRALGLKAKTSHSLEQFDDANAVSAYAKDYMATLTSLGALKGVGDGSTLAPQMYIDRASALALLDRLIKAYVTTAGEVEVDDANGFVVINTADAGKVTVTGEAAGVLVATGNKADVKLSKFNADTVKVDSPVAVTIDGSTRLGTVEVNAAAKVDSKGVVGDIQLNDKDATSNVTTDNSKPSGGGSSSGGSVTINRPHAVTFAYTTAGEAVAEGEEAVYTAANVTGLDEDGKARKGAEITFTVTGASEEYPVVEVTGDEAEPEADEEGVYTFTMPNRDVVITINAAAEAPAPATVKVVAANLGQIDDSSVLPANGLATGYTAAVTSVEDKTVNVAVEADTLTKHSNAQGVEGWWIGFGMPVDEANAYTYKLVEGETETVIASIPGRTQTDAEGNLYETVYTTVDAAATAQTMVINQYKGEELVYTYNATITVAELKTAGEEPAPEEPAASQVTFDVMADALYNDSFWATADGSKALTDMVDGTLTFTPDAESATDEAVTVKVAGKLKYVTGFTAFNSTVPAEQEGHYLPVMFVVPEDIDPKDGTLTLYGKGDSEGTTYPLINAENHDYDMLADIGDGVLAFGTLQRISGTDAVVKYTIDWDGEGDAYAATTYTLDFSELTLAAKEEEGSSILGNVLTMTKMAEQNALGYYNYLVRTTRTAKFTQANIKITNPAGDETYVDYTFTMDPADMAETGGVGMEWSLHKLANNGAATGDDAGAMEAESNDANIVPADAVRVTITVTGVDNKEYKGYYMYTITQEMCDSVKMPAQNQPAE